MLKSYKVLQDVEFKIGLSSFLYSEGNYCVLDEDDQQTKDFIKNKSIVEVEIKQELYDSMVERYKMWELIINGSCPIPLNRPKPITSPADLPKEQLDNLINSLKNK
jgi:hypothetical protein